MDLQHSRTSSFLAQNNNNNNHFNFFQVLEAFNKIMKADERKSFLYLTPGKATLKRLNKDEVAKFETQSGWDYHVKISTPSNFMICAFQDLVQLELFESAFKRVIYPS